MHQSVATIDSPKFINLQPLDINPLMSKCDIKVLYTGANRNHTFITEEVATEIGKTLRGAPIVGYYRQSKEDYTDHGEKIIIDDEGIKFECQTVPYGFVSPDAKVWFQNFEDTDENGQKFIRQYLMTTGYLWTGVFPESSLPVDEGRPSSMEFYKDSLKGYWETLYEKGIDFFIINDAIVQKICILGDDVEPCFEGASVTAPEVSTQFTLDNKFKHTLYSMMKDLKQALLNEGGQQMENTNTPVTEPVAQYTNTEAAAATNVDPAGDATVIEGSNTSTPASDYVKNDKDKDDDKSKEGSNDNNGGGSSNGSGSGSSNSDSQNGSNNDPEDDDDDKKNKNKYTLIEEELNTLKENYSALKSQYDALVEFKREIDNQKKDALIAEFYMLSDEDKADVLSNKEKYSLEDIKAKLATICFDKKINFALDPSHKEPEHKEEQVVTYSLNNDDNNNLPDWVKAVKEQEKLG